MSNTFREGHAAPESSMEPTPARTTEQPVSALPAMSNRSELAAHFRRVVESANITKSAEVMHGFYTTPLGLVELTKANLLRAADELECVDAIADAMPNEDAAFDNWFESAIPQEPFTEQHLRQAFNAGAYVQREASTSGFVSGVKCQNCGTWTDPTQPACEAIEALFNDRRTVIPGELEAAARTFYVESGQHLNWNDLSPDEKAPYYSGVVRILKAADRKVAE